MNHNPMSVTVVPGKVMRVTTWRPSSRAFCHRQTDGSFVHSEYRVVATIGKGERLDRVTMAGVRATHDCSRMN